MIGKNVTILVIALLLFGGFALRAEDAGTVMAQWREQYRRPTSIPYPPEDPYTPPKAELGRMLFFDPLLSGSRTISCASCHNPGQSWGDGLPRARGEGHRSMALRSPTLIDVAWLGRLGWDGKYRDIESVAFTPITTPDNMNLKPGELIDRLSALPGYVEAFGKAFSGGKIDKRNIELALATFERSIVAGKAPFDRWIDGDEAAIGEDAKRGFAIFNGKGRCAECHSGPSFTDGSFHDIGTARDNDIGRGKYFPSSVKLRYAFKTPTLRDVARRAPYMHDGSVPTLAAVIDLYDRGGIDRPSRSESIRPLGLSPGEKADLLAFLRTLTSEPESVSVPVLPR